MLIVLVCNGDYTAGFSGGVATDIIMSCLSATFRAADRNMRASVEKVWRKPDDYL